MYINTFTKALPPRNTSLSKYLVTNLTMKLLLIPILFLTCISESFSQTAPGRYGNIEVIITKEKRPKKIYAKVEIKSAFIGGDSSWVLSFEKNINQSIQFKNGARPGKYTVVAQFIIAKDGTISEVACLKDPGFGMGEEVVRALKKGTGKWAPASGSEVKEYRH